jgi:hypothetical protein
MNVIDKPASLHFTEEKKFYREGSQKIFLTYLFFDRVARSKTLFPRPDVIKLFFFTIYIFDR